MLPKEMRDTIAKYNMLNPHEGVVVGVSGGPDSMALLHLLYTMREQLQFDLYVAHLNHGLRSKESDADAKFVQDAAFSLNLKCTVKKISVRSYASKNKLGIEEAARELRYNFFKEVADSFKATKIALGHNADDQIETIMMWFIRGTGMGGMSGIPPMRSVGKAKTGMNKYDLTVIRPLIETSRAQIVDFLKKSKLKYRIDSSNLKPVYLRNRIRLKLLPLLRKQYNPNINNVLLQTASVLSEEESYLDYHTDKILAKVVDSRFADNKIILDLHKFLKYNINIQRRIIRKTIGLFAGTVQSTCFKNIQRVIDLASFSVTGKKVVINKNIVVQRDYERIVFIRNNIVRDNFKPVQVNLPGLTELPEQGIIIRTKIYARPKKFKVKHHSLKAYLDYEMIQTQLYVRNRIKGDRFAPLGLSGTKKIKDILIDIKIPRDYRDKIILLASNKEIIWLLGCPGLWINRIADRVKVTSSTTTVLEITIIPDKNRASQNEALDYTD